MGLLIFFEVILWTRIMRALGNIEVKNTKCDYDYRPAYILGSCRWVYWVY